MIKLVTLGNGPHLSDAFMLVLESKVIKPTLGSYKQKNHVSNSRYVIDAHKTLAFFPSWVGSQLCEVRGGVCIVHCWVLSAGYNQCSENICLIDGQTDGYREYQAL